MYILYILYWIYCNLGVYFLFPTIENMVGTERGRQVYPLTTLLRIPCILILSLLYIILPSKFRFYVQLVHCISTPAKTGLPRKYRCKYIVNELSNGPSTNA